MSPDPDGPDQPDGSGGDALAALVAATAGWDRSPEAAEVLRAELAALVSPRRRPVDGRERALLKLRSVYAKGDASALGAWLLDKPQEARFVAAYIGDPRVARWPYEDALAISDLEAVTWLELFEQAAVIPTDAARELVRVMLDTRARQTWIPASRAFAALALRCEILREELAERVRRQLPKGWPERWPGGRLSVGKGQASAGASHHRLRRTVHLICAWLGRGGDPSVVGGLSPAVVASTPLPDKDDSDASICLLGLAELLPELLAKHQTHAHGEVVEALAEQVEALSSAPQCEEVVRQLCERLERAPGLAPARVRTRLLDWLTSNRWASAPTREQPASLFAWSETASWFARRGDATALRKQVAAAGAAAFVMELVQGDAKLDDPVAALLERLEVTLTPLLLETTLPERRAPLLVELVCLLQRAELAAIDWPKLVTRALGPAHSVRLTPGTVGDVALADLPALLVRVGWPIAWLLRRTPMSREATLSIASSRSGLVARQVGVEMERLLREAGAREQRVRLFWQLIRQRPPAETHRQLRLASRGDGDLDRMNDAAAAFEASAGVDTSLADYAGAFASLLDASVASLGAHEAGTMLRPVQAALRELASEAEPAALVAAPARVVGLLERISIASGSSPVLVTGLEPGLATWFAWVEGSADTAEHAEARAELAKRLARVERTLASFEAALPVLEQAEIESTVAALDELEAALELGWPFTPVIEGLLGLLRRRVDEGQREAQASRDLAVHLRGLLDRGDDEEAVEIALDGARVALLPVGLIRRLHASLLDHLHLGVAQSLRARVRERVQLPHVLTHLAPLAVGVIGGTLLVLDVGKDWIDLANDLTTRSKISVTLTIVISLLASYGILLTGLTLSHKADMDEASASERGAFWKFARRVSLVFAGAWALAWLTSTLIMLTLGEIFSGAPLATVFAKLTMWSSLSLFLGVFLGLVLQGRRLRAD